MELWFFPLLLILYIGLSLLLFTLIRKLVRAQRPSPQRRVTSITIILLFIAIALLVWKNITPTWWYAADHPELITPGVIDLDYRVATYGWPVKFYEVEYGHVGEATYNNPYGLHMKSGFDYITFAALLGLNILSWLTILTIIWLVSERLVGHFYRRL